MAQAFENHNKPLDLILGGDDGLFSNLDGYISENMKNGALSISNAIKDDYSLRDNLEEWLFRHYLEDLGITYPYGYLSSDINKTPVENEDPISFGYDIIIDYTNSPLFNGSIENFCQNFTAITELNSRIGVIKEFKKQFFKFFKIDSPSSLGDSPDKYSNIARSQQRVRSYYLKKLSGLDSLTEKINSDTAKQFVDYGKDYLTLTLNEDISVSMGYLASLYKMLSWSRLNGKNMFPENLLRFDMTIVVTEARKYNRVSYTTGKSVEYTDIISRYVYRVYECQMFFETLSHGDTIDMTKLDISEGFDMKINYKYATMEFDWLRNFDLVNQKVSTLYNSKLAILNNALADFTKIPSSLTGISVITDNKIETFTDTQDLNKVPNSVNVGDSTIFGYYHSDSGWRDTARSSTETWQDDKNTLKYQLLNKTLENIKNNFNLNAGTIVSGFMDNGEWIYNIDAYSQNDSENFGDSILSNLINSFIGSINSGFTEDGWSYNRTAYYVNRTFNSLNNSISRALGMNFQLNTTRSGSYQMGLTNDGIQIDSVDWLNSRLAHNVTSHPRR